MKEKGSKNEIKSNTGLYIIGILFSIILAIVPHCQIMTKPIHAISIILFGISILYFIVGKLTKQKIETTYVITNILMSSVFYLSPEIKVLAWTVSIFSGLLIISFLTLLTKDEENVKEENKITSKYILDKPFKKDLNVPWPLMTEEERYSNIVSRHAYDNILVLEISEFENYKVAKIKKIDFDYHSFNEILNFNIAYSKAINDLLILEKKSDKPFQLV